MRHDLILGFLRPHQLAELSWLAGVAFADNLGVRLKHAHDLAGQLRQTIEDARLVCFTTCRTRTAIADKL